ncbi:hypothetical protein D3C84_467810 [compost metagenome]
MKVVVQRGVIKITGGNFLYLLFFVIVLIPLTLIGLFLSWALFMSKDGVFVRSIACLMMAMLPFVMVIMVREAILARTACTMIDKGRQSVIVKNRVRKDIYNVGDFKAIIVQLVSIPKASHYQAYLVGVNGKCPLGIQSMSRSKLTRIFKPISEKLGIPLEYAEQSIGFSEAMAIRESSVKS